MKKYFEEDDIVFFKILGTISTLVFIGVLAF